MKLQPECVGCILGQADRVASKIGADTQLTQKIQQTALTLSKNFSFDLTPPEVATPMYEALALVAQKRDLYDEAKKEATLHAQTMVPQLREMIAEEDNTFFAAAKMAVAGNVIDLAAEVAYDLAEEIQKVLHADFGINDLGELYEDLSNAQTLLYLADNAGEHIFDALFMEKLNALFPELSITYMTRGKPIINDVTLEEACFDGLDQYAQVKSSGMNTPGFIFKNASIEVAELFKKSDVVIAKGMGNFETMTEFHERLAYHLFKVKCQVVSQFIGHPIGTFIALKR